MVPTDPYYAQTNMSVLGLWVLPYTTGGSATSGMGFIYGPHESETRSQISGGSWILNRSLLWYRQSIPRTEPCAHHSCFAVPEKSVDGITWENADYPISPTFDSYRFAFNRPLSWQQAQPAAYNVAANAHARAYDRYVADVDSKAQLAVSLAESSQAWDMIASRFNQLTKMIKTFREKDFTGFVKAAGGFHTVSRQWAPETYGRGAFAEKDRKRVLARRRRITRERFEKSFKSDSANGWLEMQLGWLPMISDIGNAVEVLQGDFHELIARGTAKGFYDARGVRQITPDIVETSWGAVNLAFKIQGQVKVVSENLWLANRLGFVNPAAVAWAVLPGSFLFDWFLPVGRFLSSWTDMVGLAVKRSFTSSLVQADLGYNTTYLLSGSVVLRRSIAQYGFFRDLNVSTPTLGSRSVLNSPQKLQSWWKGLTAMSLFQQQLSKR